MHFVNASNTGELRDGSDYEIDSPQGKRSGSSAKPKGQGSSYFSHSDDYISITYKGKGYALTKRQAVIVQVLHAALKTGHPEVEKLKLLGAIESETSEVRSFFRNSPLRGTLVIQSRRGIID